MTTVGFGRCASIKSIVSVANSYIGSRGHSQGGSSNTIALAKHYGIKALSVLSAISNPHKTRVFFLPSRVF
jgi:hypothetical protein